MARTVRIGIFKVQRKLEHLISNQRSKREIPKEPENTKNIVAKGNTTGNFILTPEVTPLT